MRIIAVFLLFVLAATPQQPGRGSIFGLLSDRAAHLVASAPVEARNVDTGARYAVVSGDAGLYRLTGLPPGNYELTVRINSVVDFVQSIVKVTEDSPVRVDIILPLP